MNRTIAMAVLALSLAGCGWRKQHLNSGYGLSYDSAFAAQRERRDKPPAEAVTGLDAQEAAIISDGYRQGLAPAKGGSEGRESVILVPPAGSERPYVPTPSVPRE